MRIGRRYGACSRCVEIEKTGEFGLGLLQIPESERGCGINERSRGTNILVVVQNLLSLPKQWVDQEENNTLPSRFSAERNTAFCSVELAMFVKVRR